MKYKANQKIILYNIIVLLHLFYDDSLSYIWKSESGLHNLSTLDFSVVPRAYLSIYIYVFISIYLGQYAP